MQVTKSETLDKFNCDAFAQRLYWTAPHCDQDGESESRHREPGSAARRSLCAARTGQRLFFEHTPFVGLTHHGFLCAAVSLILIIRADVAGEYGASAAFLNKFKNNAALFSSLDR